MLLDPRTRNVIFDLGGILFDLDYQRTFKAFHKLAGVPVEEYFTQKKQTGLFDDLETGRIEPAQFREGLRDLIKMKATDEEIDQAWNAMLLTMAPDRIALIRKLSETHRVFLLSNTNRIHMDWLNDYFRREHQLEDFKSLFEIAWYSYEAGHRKPGTQIFLNALQEADLDPSETIFIDDNEDNVKGANQTGIRGIFLKRAVNHADFGLKP